MQLTATLFNKYRALSLAFMTTIGALLVGYLIGSEQYLIPAGLIAGLLMLAVGLPNWRWVALLIFPLIWTWTRVELPLVGGALSMERLVAIPVGLGFVYEVIIQKKPLPRLPSGAGIMLGIFSATVLIGLVANPTGAALGWMLRLLQKVIWSYLIFYVLVKADLRRLRRFVNLLTIALFIACLFGILMLIVFGSAERLTERLDGIWLIPSASVTALNIVAPAALFLIAEIGRPRHFLKKLLLSGGMIIMLLIPTVTLVRRQTLFITPIALLVALVFARRQQRTYATILLGFVGILFFAVVLPNHDAWAERYTARIVERELSDEGRYIQLQSGLAALQDSPIIGYGLGQTARITGQYTRAAGYSSSLSASHNSFLTVLVDTGLIGSIAVLGVWGSLLWGTWRALQKPLEGYLADIVRLLPALLVFIAGQWMVADALRWNPGWTLFGVIWAIIWYALHQGDAQVREEVLAT